MSLSLRDELRVVLRRDQVQLLRIGRRLALRGIQYRVLDKNIIKCQDDEHSPWSAAVKTLETALTEMPIRPARAQVILSNHFTRYAMVPWSQILSNETEEVAYAKHFFSQLFGSPAEFWELRLNQDVPGAPYLASALDGQLLHTLRALFVRVDVKLASVQPHLMAAYNNCHNHLHNQDGWFVLFEQGILCLGLIKQGHWSSVRTLKIGNDWLDKLTETLDRETYLSELDNPSDEIFLWAPEYWQSDLPESARWKIHRLQPLVRSGLAPDYDERFAVALCG